MASIAPLAGRIAMFSLSILIWEADKLHFYELKLYADSNNHLHTQRRYTEASKPLVDAHISAQLLFLKTCPDWPFMLTIVSIYVFSAEDFW